MSAEESYLPPEELERRGQFKREELKQRGLTPDWFLARKDLCLPPRMRVAVIGAGFAGLAAAWYLNECGVKTTIFEATDRLGGRVHSDRTFVPGKIVEAGAELIGENHALWGILARRFKLRLEPLTDDEDYGREKLRVRLRFGQSDLSDEQEKMLKERLGKHFATIGEQARPISETAPWQSPGAKDLDNESVAERLDKLVGRSSSLERSWFEFTLGNDNCAPVADQSYLGLLASVSAARMGSDAPGMLGYWFSTETHRCAGGNDLLADRLRQRLPDVRLRTTADRVRIEPAYFAPVTIVSSKRDASGKVVGQNQDDYHFAILSTPPTVWNTITFAPGFPVQSRAIQHGPAVKFLSSYPDRFWKQAALAPSAKWDRLGSVWEGTDKQGDAPGFDLTVFSGGPLVLPASAYAARLTELYPTRKPAAEQFVDWSAAQYIRTGYAIPGRGQVSTVSPAQLVPHEQRLYFAGEQTSSGFFGYMEGALQSGARAARDIIFKAARRCQTSSMFAGGGGGEFGGGGSSDSW